MEVSVSLGGDKKRAAGPWALVLAILGGVVWGLCFGREAVTFAPWMALVPLFLVRYMKPYEAAKAVTV